MHGVKEAEDTLNMLYNIKQRITRAHAHARQMITTKLSIGVQQAARPEHSNEKCHQHE